MTRTPRRLAQLTAASAALVLLAPMAALADPDPREEPRPAAISERQALPEADGWASAEGGTTGGSSASSEHIYDVSTRGELVAALDEAGSAPKIIRVHGVLEANAEDDGTPISCQEIAEGTGYDHDAYLEAYAPETWGTDREPEGPQEDARDAAAQRQRELIQIDVPSHTTIIGSEEGSGLRGASLVISGAQNVIVRNLVLSDTYDCFPAWDPTDGETGAWNSEYDSVRIVDGSRNIWVDHNLFTDRSMTDDTLPSYFGSTYQRHDGALDITNASDLVTVSWNEFSDHDKLTLVGSTDSPDRGDPGHLRATFHHNRYSGVGQRAPRVRFGQVDVYNNSYVVHPDQPVAFGYFLGAGYDSHVWAEANTFDLGGVAEPGDIITSLGGTRITTEDNLVDGRRVDLRAAYNAGVSETEQLSEDTTWRPQRRDCVDPVRRVETIVETWSGPRFGPAPARIRTDCRG